MGKGGYNGGSTIIGPWSGWFSAGGASKPEKSQRKIENSIVSTAPLRKDVKKATNDATRNKNTLKNTKVKVAQIDVNALRLSYLHAIISAMISKSSVPNPPKDIRSAIISELASCGGELAWARQQPQYEAILAKKMKKAAPLIGRLPPKRPTELAIINEANTTDELRRPEKLRALKLEYARLEKIRSHAMAAANDCSVQLIKLQEEIDKLLL